MSKIVLAMTTLNLKTKITSRGSLFWVGRCFGKCSSLNMKAIIANKDNDSEQDPYKKLKVLKFFI